MPTKLEISPKHVLLVLLFCIFSSHRIFSQCIDGIEPECTCETAPVLCSIDELDNYVFSMASYLHPWDGPTPICPGKSNTQTNNPTWFAFTTWCTDLTLRVTPSDCQEVFNTIGVQVVIYEDCTFETAVACEVAAVDCNANAKVLVMSGLTIGEVYYFMVDGCYGSDCTVTIDVVGACGEEDIAPWTLPMAGEMQPCMGATETYTTEVLTGASLYHWFVDGELIAESSSASVDISWSDAGSYQLCIDASHEPCVPITAAPPALCVTINVKDADAGILNVPLSPLCLNEIALVSSSGYLSGVDNIQMLLVTDAAGEIVLVIPAAEGFFTSGTSGTFTVYAYNYIPGLGTVPAIGSTINQIDCSSGCCDLISQPITFQGIQAAISNIVCDDNGTGNDPEDDTFTFDILVTGQAASTSWQSTDGSLNGTYGAVLLCGPYLIADGPVDVILQDGVNMTCVTNLSVAPPSSCSVCLQTIDAGQGITITCANTSTTLMGWTSEMGTYSWTGPEGFMSNLLMPVVSDSGWYYLSALFTNQCTAADSVYIALDADNPMIDAGDGSTINCVNTAVTLNGTISNAVTFYWTGPDAFLSESLSITVSNPGWYFLNAAFANQCMSIDSAFVGSDTSAPLADAGPDHVLSCDVMDVFLDGSASSGNGLRFEWSNSNDELVSVQSSFFINVPDIYTLTLTDTTNGCFSIDEVVVTSYDNVPELIAAEVLPESCIGESNGLIEAISVTGGVGPYTYMISGVDTNMTGFFADLQPGLYTLQITDSEGCKTDTLLLIDQGIDLQLELPAFVEWVVGQSGFIEANVNVPEEDLSTIAWSPPGLLSCDTCLRTSIDEEGSYTFQLIVVHERGCEAIAEINISVVPQTEIYIPNVFSPNGDGINDYFTLYANERVEKVLEIHVFDRWGGLIFQRQHFDPNDESAGWDGMSGGKTLLPSVFAYTFKVLLKDGTTQLISGEVTLLR